jgi:hypothetical protein
MMKLLIMTAIFYSSIALVGLVLPYGIPRSHSDTPHSVGLPGRLKISTQRPLPVNTQRSQQTNSHFPRGNRTHKSTKRAAADLHLTRRGHRNRQ